MTSECQPHPLNRHLFIADNLDLLRRLDNESIDLICIDPPFKKSRTFVGRVKPPLTDSELAAEQEILAGWGINNPQQALDAHINWASKSGDVWFKDMWSYDQDVDEDWVQSIAKQHTALHWVIEAAKVTDGMATAAYLCYMGVRLIQMHRALKPTGSLYLHCDGDANYYLRMALNAIFGTSNFRNEIVWHYNKWTNAASHFQRNHDTVLFYAKSEVAQYNKQFVMTEHKARVLAKGWDSNVVQGGIRQLLVYDQEKAKSEIDNPKYDRIVYRDDADGGTAMPDVWADINYLSSGSKERTGYPTQKPVALAERIIKAATNPGDVVLDCFAGCAYVPVAAERNGRQWIACDISPRALTVLRRQFAKFRYAVDGRQQTEQPALLTDADVVTAGPNNLPERSDEDPEPRIDPKEPEPPKYKTPASIIPEQEMLRQLLELSDWQAWCCGFANRRKDGAVIETTRNFHLDHLNPKSKEGASNQITNRAPMCPHHNIRKNNRRVHLAEYRQEIADAGELMVDNAGELIDLTWAGDQALEIYTQARIRQGG